MQVASGSVFSALLPSLPAYSWGCQSDGPILLLSSICSQTIVTPGVEINNQGWVERARLPNCNFHLDVYTVVQCCVKGSGSQTWCIDLNVLGDKITVEFPFVLSGKNKSHQSVSLFRPLKRVCVLLGYIWSSFSFFGEGELKHSVMLMWVSAGSIGPDKDMVIAVCITESECDQGQLQLSLHSGRKNNRSLRRSDSRVL